MGKMFWVFDVDALSIICLFTLSMVMVCKSWQVTINSEQKPSSPPKFPWLMLAEKRRLRTRRCFFSLSSYRVHKLDLPEASERKCFGAGFGWLLTLGDDFQINLLHPFSRYKISLPPYNTFSNAFNEYYPPESLRQFFLRKAVLSSNPWKKGLKISSDHYKQEGCTVMVINGTYCELAFARLGDKQWTLVKVPSRRYEDIAYYKGQFYAVDCHGVVVRCRLDRRRGPKAMRIAPPPVGTRDWFQKYLVESMGDLLLVSLFRSGKLYDPEGKHKKRYFTTGFSILKMGKCAEEGTSPYEYLWEAVTDLGNRSLFLGFNSSILLSAPDFDDCFEANCIYFTDDNTESYLGGRGGGYDMGIFNLKDQTIRRHYQSTSLSRITPPLWYI